MKKSLAFLLAIAIIAAYIPTFASSSMMTLTQKESDFSAAIQQLEAYLESSENDPTDLIFIQDSFDKLDKYENSNFFKYYVTVLLKIENNEFDSALDMYLTILDTPPFVAYLASFDSIKIRPIEELKQYALGRRSQYQGNKALACECYSKCLAFYDADDRYIELQSTEIQSTYDRALVLLEAEEYVEAYQLFSTISEHKDSAIFMAYIETKLGSEFQIITPEPTLAISSEQAATTKQSPAPTEKPTAVITVAPTAEPTLSLNISISVGYNKLSWNSINGAVSYTVRRHRTNGSYADIITTNETSYKDQDVSDGYKYFYTVVANLQNGTTIFSDEQTVVAATSQKEHTHNWVAATCTQAKTCSTCGVTEGSALGHNWQAADCTHAKTCSRCGATEGSALGHSWQAATEYAPKTCSRCGTTEGSKLTRVTEYRYRDSYETYSVWSSWSSWGDKKTISDSNLMEEESKKRYCWWAAECRNCGQHNPYWGSSSKCNNCGQVLSNVNHAAVWTDEVSGTQTIYGRSNGRYINGKPYWRSPGDDRVQYRYRTRTIVTVTGDWSDWSTTKPADKTGREIDMRTVIK